MSSLTEHEIAHLRPDDKIEIIRPQVQKNVRFPNERSNQRHDTRARILNLGPSQEVFRRNCGPRNFQRGFNA